jgi:hypothetical protein
LVLTESIGGAGVLVLTILPGALVIYFVRNCIAKGALGRVKKRRGGISMDWTWTIPTATFFVIIAATLVTFTVLAIKYWKVPPHQHALDRNNAGGDRLFITLLGSPFLI